MCFHKHNSLFYRSRLSTFLYIVYSSICVSVLQNIALCSLTLLYFWNLFKRGAQEKMRKQGKFPLSVRLMGGDVGQTWSHQGICSRTEQDCANSNGDECKPSPCCNTSCRQPPKRASKWWSPFSQIEFQPNHDDDAAQSESLWTAMRTDS